MTDLEEHRKLIEHRLNELRVRLRSVEAELDHPGDRDLEDQAIDLEDDEVLEGVGRAGQREIALLESALARIDDKSFGVCQSCGDAISDARLRAVPYAILCRDCANSA